MRIRQVALCTDDIWREEQRLVRELGIAAVHRDPPNVFGMRNAVFAVGNTFLEVLQPEARDAPTARFLDRHDGPGGYMLILQVDDLESARARADALGVRIVHDQPTASIHGVSAAAIHLHPADTGGTLISFDQMDPADGWSWAGRSWQSHVHTEIIEAIVGVELRSHEPTRLAERFSLLVGRPLSSDGVVELEGGRVTFVGGPAGSPDVLSAVEVRTSIDHRVGTACSIAGTEIRLLR